MSLIDRYIAGQYLTNILVLFLILFGFVVAVDASVNLERLAENAVKLEGELEAARLGLPAPPPDFRVGPLRTVAVTALAIADLWWPRLIQLFNFLLGTVLVTAMGFTCSQLVKNREFLAMLSAGQSLYRVGRPIVLVALAMTALAAINQEFLLPRIAPLVLRDHGQARRDRADLATLTLAPDAAGTLFAAERFDSRANDLQSVIIVERDDRGLARRVITAPAADWRDNAWHLTSPRAIALTTQPGNALAALPSAIDTNLTPDEIKLRLYRGYQQSLSLRQLASMLKRDDLLNDAERQRLQRIVFGRLSTMASSVLTLLIAMPFFVTREPRPMILQALKCAPVSIITIAGGVIGSTAAIPGLDPAVSSFVPVFVLLPLAVATVFSVRT